LGWPDDPKKAKLASPTTSKEHFVQTWCNNKSEA